MDEQTITLERPIEDVSARGVARECEQAQPQMEGGGSGGRGPRNDDDGRRRPDRDGGDARRILVALGIIAVGAGVMSARLLSRARRPGRMRDQ